jgi:hypothetical protein
MLRTLAGAPELNRVLRDGIDAITAPSSQQGLSQAIVLKT